MARWLPRMGAPWTVGAPHCTCLQELLMNMALELSHDKQKDHKTVDKVRPTKPRVTEYLGTELTQS